MSDGSVALGTQVVDEIEAALARGTTIRAGGCLP